MDECLTRFVSPIGYYFEPHKDYSVQSVRNKIIMFSQNEMSKYQCLTQGQLLVAHVSASNAISAHVSGGFLGTAQHIVGVCHLFLKLSGERNKDLRGATYVWVVSAISSCLSRERERA